MLGLRTIALAGLVTTGMASAAAAADLSFPPLPAAPILEPAPEAFSGFYLRGDIAVGQINGRSEIIDTNPFVTPARVRGFNDDFGSHVAGGVGAGFQFNSWLRADITGEYRTKASLSVQDKYCESADPVFNIAGRPCAAGRPAGSFDGVNAYRGNIASWVFLVNGYVDLGTWHGLTPFIGGGVGFSHNRISGLTDQGSRLEYITDPVSGLVTGGPFTPTGPTFLSSRERTEFAWALMAGLAYDVLPNAKLEIGYRYLNLGSIQSGTAGCGAACTSSLRIREIDSHEVRFGMRWMLGGHQQVAAAEPLPPRIVKKY